MPTFPFPWTTRPDARAIDALLAGTCHAEEAPAELRAVAEVFGTLRAPADQREVAGWDQALITYRGMTGLPEAPNFGRSHRRRKHTATPLGTKLAAAAGVTVVAVLSGGVAAAYTGHLPGALQNIAHHTIAAPAARETRAVPAPTPNGSVHPVGPSATGSAVYGLCRAYERAGEHGKAAQHSVAFHNLVTAAGGADQVPAYCAKIEHPGQANPSASAPGQRAGQSGSPGHPTHHPQGKPTPTPTKTRKQHGGGNGHGNQSP